MQDSTVTPGENRLVFPSLPSTSRYCREHPELADGTVVIAARQTQGRGRGDRHFVSEPGGVYLSVVWKPVCRGEALLPLTALCAVAACRALAGVCGITARIKWPNDLVYQGKKIAGLLTEPIFDGQSAIPERVIVGVGLNAAQPAEAFPGSLREMASSVALLTGQTVDIARLTDALVRELFRAYACLDAPDAQAAWLDAYRAACLTLGQDVYLLQNGTRTRARAIGVTDTFALEVVYPDGTQAVLSSGEVSVRGLYGYVET